MIDYDFGWHVSHPVFSAAVPRIWPIVSETWLFFQVLNFDDFLKQESLVVPPTFDQVFPKCNQHRCENVWLHARHWAMWMQRERTSIPKVGLLGCFSLVKKRRERKEWDLRKRSLKTFAKRGNPLPHLFPLESEPPPHFLPHERMHVKRRDSEIISWGCSFGSAWSQGGNSECCCLLEPQCYFCCFVYGCGETFTKQSMSPWADEADEAD